MFFTVEKIEHQLNDIRDALRRETIDIKWFKYHQGECPGAEAPGYDDRDWQDFQVGDAWGGYDLVAWFRAWLEIPEAWRDKRLELRFVVGPRDGGQSTTETMLYVNGSPLQAIDTWHEEAWLPPECLQEGRVLLALKAWSGVQGVPDRRRFKVAQLIWIDEPTEHFYYTADTLLKAIKELGEHDWQRVKLVQALQKAFLSIDYLVPRSEEFYGSVEAARRSLDDQLAALQMLETAKPKVIGLGHAHIDMAWLWRLSHSREKAARTFTTALHLMRQYPDYRFVHSSPQLYQFLKEDYPQIYARVKEKIASGQWGITGGMWVEADTNIPSGESLVRQFLFGMRFIREEFGAEGRILWLPDVFGYSWALPQIVKKCGLRYFMTTKISWSQFNRFPYDTFQWRGIDGTQLLTHFVTTPDEASSYFTYNARMTPKEVIGIWNNYRQKELNDELLLLYGWGDGGGGPTKEMLESARVLRNVPGLPQVELDSAEDYFERLEKRLAGKELPVWDGELYLEYHRGTYTSQAATKRANRQAEILYHNAEWLNALADSLLGRQAYPEQELQRGWELILLNQFHDILPGSSIHPVYEDSRQQYETAGRIGQEAVQEAQERLVENLPSPRESLVVFNSLSWERGGLVGLPWSPGLEARTVEGADGKPAERQVVQDGNERMVLLPVGDVPALGYRTYPLVQAQRKRKLSISEIVITPGYIENRLYRIEINARGQLTSVYDKRHQREVLAPERRGNVLQAFEDKPLNFDAWDIDIYYQEKMREVDNLLEAVVEESGPLRGTLRLTWRFNRSTITQHLSVYRESPRIDFRSQVDWQEQQVLLKAAFPLDVRSTRATYEIQFGNIERPTHWNTSWDYARFEVVAHKWADLSEGDYGASLLNDCKYGHDARDNVLRLTLIKSAIDPDPTADQGLHTFTYSLLPHGGDWRRGEVTQAAYDLNYPLLARRLPVGQSGSLPAAFSFVQVDAPNVIVETVKKAEGQAAWIVRLYEFQQRRSDNVGLVFGRSLARAVECNLIEEEQWPAQVEGNRLAFRIYPYEIKTFKVWFAGSISYPT